MKKKSVHKKQDYQLKDDPVFKGIMENIDQDYLNIRKEYNCYKQLYSRGNINIIELRDKTNVLMQIILDTEKTYELLNIYTVMNFSLLKMKTCMLLGFIYLDCNMREYAFQVFSPVLMTLTNKLDFIEFKHDYMFQSEVNYLLDILWLTHGENIELQPYKNINININLHVHSRVLSEKCGPNFYKLKWSYLNFKSRILANEKHGKTNSSLYNEYIETFNIIDKKFKDCHSKKTLTLQTFFDYFNAHIITFQFRLKTQPALRYTSVYTAINNNDKDYINKYIKLHQELMDTHLLPALTLFQTNYKKLKNNAIFINHFTWTYSEFFQILTSQFYVLIVLNDILENDFKNPNKSLLEKQITDLYENTINLLNCCNEPTPNTPGIIIQLNSNIFHHEQEPFHLGHNTDLLKTVYSRFMIVEKENKKIYESELALQEQIAKKNSELLIRQEEKERIEKYKKRPKKKPILNIPIPKIQVDESQSDDEPVDEPAVNPVQEHMDNGLHMLKRKDYPHAINYFLLAKNEAQWQKNDYLQLSAIDALTVAYSYTLQKELDTITTTLNRRLRTTQPLSDNMQNDLECLLNSVNNGYVELGILYQNYLHAMGQYTANKPPEIIQDLSQGQETICSLINSIKRKIDIINKKNDELNEKKSAERIQFYTKLGTKIIRSCERPGEYTLKELKAIGKIKFIQLLRKKDEKSAQLIKNHSFMVQLGLEFIQSQNTTEDYSQNEILELGKIKFHQLGRIKNNNQSGQSIYTRETNLLNQLQSVFKDMSHHASSRLINDSNISAVSIININITHPVNTLFQYLNDVSLEHYLVGSSVINILLAHWNLPLIKTHDFDFITATPDHKALLRSGFVQSQKMKNLYFGTVSKQKVELFCLNQETNWLAKSLSSRHFTIAALALYYDDSTHRAFVIDPIGTGCDDLKNKCIRMIGDPLSRLQDDPTIAIAVIKYELLGFTADTPLIEALCQLTINEAFPRERVNAVLTKLLKQADQYEVLKRLEHYGLLGTLFDLNPEGDANQTLFELKKKISLTAPGLFLSPYGLFSPSANITVNKNCELETSVFNKAL